MAEVPRRPGATGLAAAYGDGEDHLDSRKRTGPQGAAGRDDRPRMTLGTQPASDTEDEARRDREASTDAGWFDDHPKRRYRTRPGWVVRRVAGVHLRTPTPTLPTKDGESEAENAWWTAAWPQLTEKTRNKLIRKARKRSR